MLHVRKAVFFSYSYLEGHRGKPGSIYNISSRTAYRLGIYKYKEVLSASYITFTYSWSRSMLCNQDSPARAFLVFLPISWIPQHASCMKIQQMCTHYLLVSCATSKTNKVETLVRTIGDTSEVLFLLQALNCCRIYIVISMDWYLGFSLREDLLRTSYSYSKEPNKGAYNTITQQSYSCVR